MQIHSLKGRVVFAGVRHLASVLFVFCWLALLMVNVLGEPEAKAQLLKNLSIPFSGQNVTLAKGSIVQVLNESGDSATVSVQLPDGSPLITQIPIANLQVASVSGPATPSKGSGKESVATTGDANSVANTPNLPSQGSATAASNDVSPAANSANSLDHEGSGGQNLPTFSGNLDSLDGTLPPKRYTALHGYFYILINGAAIPVVYALPLENHHLAKSASNMVFYGPYPGEQTKLTGNIVPKIVENLGCTVFSLCFKQRGHQLVDPETAYWDNASPWFPAVMSARDEIIKGFGLERRKLLLMGYSGGGGMVLNLAGVFPNEVEAVAAQGANLAPNMDKKSDIKWLIVNNRGELNAATTVPFYDKLRSMGCSALYCETTPERGRGNYHSPSGQAFDLIYSFIAGVLTQRDLSAQGVKDTPHIWPYVAPRDPLKRYGILKTADLDQNTLEQGQFDFLPSSAFALNWAKVCAPMQTVTPTDGGSIHVTFPACNKPVATVIYYAQPKIEDIARVVEDVNSLAEHGYIVVSPSGSPAPEGFAKAATSWIGAQGSYVGSRIHLLGYGRPGADFIATMATSPTLDLSIKSISLVDLEDSQIDEQTEANVETLARSCGMYGFFLCSATQPNNKLSQLADDLVTKASQQRGCSKLIVTRKITPDMIASDEAKVSSDGGAMVADGNQVAMDNDKSAGNAWKDPRDLDQAFADQEQVIDDQARFASDHAQSVQDQKQADAEQRNVEDQALKMVKTLIDRSNRS